MKRWIHAATRQPEEPKLLVQFARSDENGNNSIIEATVYAHTLYHAIVEMLSNMKFPLTWYNVEDAFIGNDMSQSDCSSIIEAIREDNEVTQNDYIIFLKNIRTGQVYINDDSSGLPVSSREVWSYVADNPHYDQNYNWKTSEWEDAY